MVKNTQPQQTYQTGGAISFPQFGFSGTINPYGLGSVGLSSVVDNGILQVYNKDTILNSILNNRYANPNTLYMSKRNENETDTEYYNRIHSSTLKETPNVSAYAQGEARRLPEQLISNDDNDTIIVYGNRKQSTKSDNSLNELPQYVRDRFNPPPPQRTQPIANVQPFTGNNNAVGSVISDDDDSYGINNKNGDRVNNRTNVNNPVDDNVVSSIVNILANAFTFTSNNNTV
jgi:hypothetical protein